MGKANEDVVCRIVEEELRELKVTAGFPTGSQLLALITSDRPQLCPSGFVGFYEYPFKNGFRFPFTPLIRRILEMYDISPGQLMPLVGRVYVVLERATNNWTEKVTLADLCRCYEFRKKEMERVTVYRRSGYRLLVERDDVNDRGWKARYFFLWKSLPWV